MKRAKKAIIAKEKVVRYVYSITCPHCKTVLIGGFGDETVRMKCSRCGEIIELVHEDVMGGE